MENVLENCLYIKHLQLHLKGFDDLINGQRWETLAKSLITFNFQIDVDSQLSEQAFDSFHTPFWLEEKQWFVAYKDYCLFSVPYFAPKQMNISCKSFVHSTAPQSSIFYQNVTKLIVERTPILQKELLYTLNLQHIHSLTILYLEDLLQFTPLKRKLPYLSKLSFRYTLQKIPVDQMKKIFRHSYEEIRTLEINSNLADQKRILKELFRLFPRTEYLIYQFNIQSTALMICLIDGFEQLSHASFKSSDPWCLKNEKYFYLNPDSMIIRSNRRTYRTTMCRIYHLRYDRWSLVINWWIEK
jgi:hypothetical protein